MTNCAGFEVDVNEYLNFLVWCDDTVDWNIGTRVLEKLIVSNLSISKNSNISLGQQGTPKQWYVYSYVHGIMSKKLEILKWQIVLLMVNISRKHRLSCSNCSYFDNHIFQRNNDFFTKNSQPHTIFISATKGKFAGSDGWKGLQTPIQEWERAGNAYGSTVQC